MLFFEKLYFLMSLFNIRNAELARLIFVDPAQISRFRSGVRRAPNTETLRRMAEVFARRCKAEHQLSAVIRITGDDSLLQNADESALSDAIFAYLSDNNPTRGTENGMPRHPHTQSADGGAAAAQKPFIEGKYMVFQGADGKQAAIRYLLTELLQKDALPDSMFYFCDESSDWLMRDSIFLREFSDMMTSLAIRGCDITHVIQPLTDINDAYRSFSLWLPLYLTGRAHPYFFPGLRDGILRSTQLIIPGVAAVVSSSVNQGREDDGTIVHTDPHVVEHFARKFLEYRDLCRPALTLYDPSVQMEGLSRRLTAYYGSESDSYRMSDSLSFLTIPRERKRDFEARSGSAVMRMLCRHAISSVMPAENQLFSRVITDIISLAPVGEVLSGRVRYCIDHEALYTPAEYRCQLEGMITLLERYPKYRAILNSAPPVNCTFYAKEGVGALLFLREAPYNVIEITSPIAFSPVLDYLRHITEINLASGNDKRAVLARLRAYISNLPMDREA